MSKENAVNESEIKLGDEYEDTLTGWKGRAVAKYEYLHGCLRYELEALKDGKPESFIFDAPRLRRVADEAAVTSARTGGYKPDPAAHWSLTMTTAALIFFASVCVLSGACLNAWATTREVKRRWPIPDPRHPSQLSPEQIDLAQQRAKDFQP